MQISVCAEWHYEMEFQEVPEKLFDVVILAREITEEELSFLEKYTKSHCLFVMDFVEMQKEGPTRWLYVARRGKKIDQLQLEVLLRDELKDYFSYSYGEKFNPFNLTIAHNFKGSIKWNGYQSVELEGKYGDDFQQIVFWKNNIPVESEQTIEFWLEYKKDPTVEISMEITQFFAGSVSGIQNRWEFSEENLNDIVYIENLKARGPVFVSLKAKGKGKLAVIALHDRHSRRGKGCFIPGGKRMVTSDREEIFYYFDPGNLTPPLNVYFSGYKTQEGFEAYYMMRKMEHPFLLISDARLEGGAFYLGTEEYEKLLVKIIKYYIKALNFKHSDVILSGLSMGTFGALYYGCQIHPHAIIVGKPLASIGDVAVNERIRRPGGFPTSLDVLWKHAGGMDSEAVQRLNDRFWNAFDNTNWKGTKFAAAYMIEDDYDSTAYGTLLLHLKDAGVQIYGKGLHGRHNDDSTGIVTWFANQYKKIIVQDFENKEGR